MSENRRAPDVHQRLLDLHRQQPRTAADEEADEDGSGEQSVDRRAFCPADLSRTFLSSTEARLARLLGCQLLVSLSDRRLYCGRLYCIDRLSLLLADAVQRVQPTNQQQQTEAAAADAPQAAHAAEAERGRGQQRHSPNTHLTPMLLDMPSTRYLALCRVPPFAIHTLIAVCTCGCVDEGLLVD